MQMPLLLEDAVESALVLVPTMTLLYSMKSHIETTQLEPHPSINTSTSNPALMGNMGTALVTLHPYITLLLFGLSPGSLDAA